MRKSSRFLVGLAVSFLLIALMVSPSLLAQNPGDQPTAGFTDSRAYLNSDAGNFKPPLTLAQTLDLEIGIGSDTLSVFENLLLIGRGGDPSSYLLFDRETGQTDRNLLCRGVSLSERKW